MTIIEKILAMHSGKKIVSAGDIVDMAVDVRLARDFGGASVIRHLEENGLSVNDPSGTWFTFDCNPTGSDQKYATNQHYCRMYSREHGIRVFDIDAGIGTHLAIDQGLAVPGSTLVSTDSHANIMGAIGAFGQGMGDQDIAAAWAFGKIWFQVPASVKIVLHGNPPSGVYAKDMVLNLLGHFGTGRLLGKSAEIIMENGPELSLDERITIASMATEMGAVALLFPPSEKISAYCRKKSGKSFDPVYADSDAKYDEIFHLDCTRFKPLVSLPGKPHDVTVLDNVAGTRIDSAFIGSCTNGRMEDLRTAARILEGKKVAPAVVLKIVPATNEIWKQCLEEGLIRIFKNAGALVGNAGCAGCAAGQIGQNGPGEITVSTGNRNFTGKQGRGEVFLASPAVAAASAVAGCISPENFKTTGKQILHSPVKKENEPVRKIRDAGLPSDIISGKVWIIDVDNIDTDMIYHNQFLSVISRDEMGRHTFGNLKGWENYAGISEPGDIVITGKNFGSGSSRQQAVDCFMSLKNQAILARSFGSIYERNAINAAFPVLIYEDLEILELKNRTMIRINLSTGKIQNLENGKETLIHPFSDIQMRIYRNGGLLNLK